jgi:hypothetical protein
MTNDPSEPPVTRREQQARAVQDAADLARYKMFLGAFGFLFNLIGIGIIMYIEGSGDGLRQHPILMAFVIILFLAAGVLFIRCMCAKRAK